MSLTKYILVGLGVLALSMSCKKDEEPPVEEDEIVYFIAPDLTNAEYASGEEPHYILKNRTNQKNRLLLFIGGTYSKPDTYSIICEHAVGRGLDVISISYPNNVPAASLKDSDNLMAFDLYRDELCFGNPGSDAVEIDELNSIVSRLVNLLNYLQSTYPEQDWNKYLVDENTPDWSKIIVSGHSQGSGHSAYLAKTYSVYRNVMFSGPNDYSNHFDAPANWLSLPGVTPNENQFVLLHIEDEVVPYSSQLANIQSMGLLGTGESTTLMDNLSSPFNNDNCFHTNITALISSHSSTTGGNNKLKGLWNYMFDVE